jgi:hypothetical protein
MSLTDAQIKLLFPVLMQEQLSSSTSGVKIEWALSLLAQGVETKSLLGLVSLTKPVNEFEADNYFNGTLEELGIKRPDNSYLINSYVKYIVEKILHGELLPEVGMEKLSALHSYSRLVAFKTPSIIVDALILSDDYACESLKNMSVQERRDEIICACKEANLTLQYARLQLEE